LDRLEAEDQVCFLYPEKVPSDKIIVIA